MLCIFLLYVRVGSNGPPDVITGAGGSTSPPPPPPSSVPASSPSPSATRFSVAELAALGDLAPAASWLIGLTALRDIRYRGKSFSRDSTDERCIACDPDRLRTYCHAFLQTCRYSEVYSSFSSAFSFRPLLHALLRRMTTV